MPKKLLKPYLSKVRRGLTVSILCALLSAPVALADAADGHWTGRLDAPGQRIGITVDLSQDADGWRGAIDIPVQGLNDFPLSDIEVDGDKVSFAMAGVPGDPVFRGNLKKDGERLVGRLFQGGAAVPFRLKREGAAQLAAAPKIVLSDSQFARLAGRREGSMRAGGRTMRMALDVKQGADGEILATIDSLDQKQQGLPVSHLTLDGDQVRAELAYAGAVYEGKLDPVDGSIQGFWRQQGQSFALKLERDGDAPSIAAPSNGAPSAEDPFPAASPEQVGLKKEALDLLTEHVESLVDGKQIVGGELLVIKNRRTVLRRAYGFQDRASGRSMPEDAVYCVRSMTKPLVGTAIQMLIDEGKLSPETPVHEILPAFAGEKTRAITVEHLLTHRAGFPFTTLSRPLTSYDSLQDVAAESAERGPDFEPGTAFQYSDAGSDTLGAVVEAITGKPVERFIADRILKPLGMDDSYPLLDTDTWTQDLQNRTVTAYSGGTGSWQPHWSPSDEPIFPIFLSSQSLFSTTVDYARFLALWMDEGKIGERRLLSERAVRQGLEPRSALEGYPAAFDSLDSFYGRQWIVYTDGESAFPTVFGHDGSDGTHAWAWPDEDLMVLFFTQSRGTLAGLALADKIQRRLVDGDLRPDSQSADRDLTVFEGLYWDETAESSYYVVTAADGRLTIERPGGMRWTFLPGDDPQRFTHEALPDVWIEFVSGEEGPQKPHAMRTHFGGSIELDPRHVPASDLPSVDEVVERVIAAHGLDRLDEIGSIRLQGELEAKARGLKGSIDVRFDALRQRTELRFEPAGGGLTEIEINDGEQVRLERSVGGNETLDGARLEHAMLERFIVRFGDWRKHYVSLDVLKRVEEGDRKALLVRAVPHEAPGATLVVDEDTGRLLVADTLVHLPGLGTVGVRAHYGDYQELGDGGPVLPLRVRSKFAAQLIGTIDVRFTEHSVEPELDPSLFVAPAAD